MENSYEYHEDGGGDFYESFEMELEEDEITTAEEGFMIGFVGLEED
ncbi:hypothetical protein HYU17_00650 [Candidatus Woesearchaeota archaeon]|nr:hypothetical protein [Candidatus Woesearchaeota archaeon]